MAKCITSEIKDYRVSSVLNNDRKSYGKKYLFDGNDETCWNSDRGSPQWIEFSFDAPKSIEQISIQFQGGFAAKSCTLESASTTPCDDVADKDPSASEKVDFFPKDTNASQTFKLNQAISSKQFKLAFVSSYDFYGRITIYNMDILGN